MIFKAKGAKVISLRDFLLFFLIYIGLNIFSFLIFDNNLTT